jgi:hypothetical protein
MTVKDFKNTMFQIDSIKWIDDNTKQEVFPLGDEKVVDAYFSATNEIITCAVYIKR